MKKITKLMLTLTLLLVGVTGANAAEETIYTMDYSTATSYGFFKQVPENASVGVENGLLVITNTTNQEENYTLQLHIGSGFTTTKGNDYIVKIEYKATIDTEKTDPSRAWVALGNWTNKETNYWVPLSTTDDFQTLTLNFYGGDEHPGFQYDVNGDAFVLWQSGDVVGTIYIKKVEVIEITSDEPDVDRWLLCDGTKGNSWDRQASYSFTTPLEQGVTYVVSADILSVEGGKCGLWSLWEASTNRDQWGGTADVQYLAENTVNNTLTTYTWEFTTTWANDKISFVFGTTDGIIYFDNVSCKKKGTDTELIANGDFAKKSLDRWSNSGNTTFKLEKVSTEPITPTVWTTIIDNDPRCMISKEYPAGYVLPAKINDDGEFVVNAPAKVSESYDSQFWIRLPQTLAAGKRFKLSLEYKASQNATVNSQSHNEPGQYIHYSCAGDFNFTSEWQLFSGTITVPAECNGDDNSSGYKNDFRSIAFNLSQNEAVDFYFRNIKVEIDENDVTEPDYPADIYIVAGTEDLCGVAWNTRSMDNQMTLNSETGLYEKKYENVTINSESYPQFKVVKNCSWDTAWPSSNYVINTGTSGLFNITITFDPETENVTVDAEEIYTMTVAGDNVPLFGTSWDPVNTTNDLTKNEDGTYSITYENKVLSEGTIQFKVVKNHSWGEAYPAEDYVLNIPRSSIYDVTITFYPENKAVEATIKDNGVASSYYLVGGEKNADWAPGTALTEKEGVYSIEIPYSSEYSFAIAPNTALNDNKDNVVNWNVVIRPTETTSVDFENVSGEVTTTDNKQNWIMVEKGNGEEKDFNALFSYDSNTGTWTITASTTTRIGETGYATYSNAKPYTVEGATANFVTVDNKVATLVPQDADAILPAMTGAGKNAGVILKGDAGTVTINAADKDAEATAVGIENNLLAGSGNYSYGISTQFAENDPYTAYIFTQPEGKELGFYIADLNAGADLPAHKAFLAVPKGADAREFIGFDAGETTSIADNNRVTITNNGDVYNLNGQRVAQPTKGLYIVNGKKVVIR